MILLGFFLTPTGIAQMPEPSIIAINIAITPESAMSDYAKNMNRELQKIYPQGFSLDDSHHPHITILQQYIKRDDLENIYHDLNNLMIKASKEAWKFDATKFSIYPVNNEMGALFIDIKSTPQLLELQHNIIALAQPYSVTNGTASAFDRSQNEPEINQFTLDYVRDFVKNSAGDHYHPHITLGIAPITELQRWQNQLPTVSSFIPASITIFQLGDNGTARKRLGAQILNPASK